MFDPQTDLFISAIRQRERIREAEVARALGTARRRQRRRVAATLRHLAERADPPNDDSRLEGMPV